MNEREKRLLFVLGFTAFVIANIFAFNLFQKGMNRMKAEAYNGAREIKEKTAAIRKADENPDEWNWWVENQPAEGVHGGIRADLATYVERSAGRFGVQTKGRPTLLPEDLSETGDYRSAAVKVVANGRDAEIYRWLSDLQDPKKFRSITRLEIRPQRDEPTRMDCELEVAQWFVPMAEGEEISSLDTE